MDLKKESNRIEQRTLLLSLLIGSVLYLTAARQVARPADRRLQHGDAASVAWFGALTGLICAVFGTYELGLGRRTGSQLLRNDAREWLINAAFSLVTLMGFAVLFVLEDPLRSTWVRYADSALVALLALLFLPIPLGAVGRPIDAAWLTINFTADPRWA